MFLLTLEDRAGMTRRPKASRVASIVLAAAIAGLCAGCGSSKPAAATADAAMRPAGAAVAFIGALAAVTAERAKTARPGELCVGHGSSCHRTVQGAVDAARDGDTVRIGRGNFAGAVRIGASIRLVGAGSRLTTIRGGGPVLTIGAFGAAREPTVSVTGVTIAGGLTRSSAESRKLVGNPGACGRPMAPVREPHAADWRTRAPARLHRADWRGGCIDGRP